MTQEERKRIGAEYVRINRKLENIWFPKVKAAIKSKISSLINKIQDDGIEAGRRYIEMDLANFKLTDVIEDMYRIVGLKHARLNEMRLRSEVGKSYHVSQEAKGLGSSRTWVKWIQDYLYKFLIEKITFKVNETTRDHLLKVLNEAIENGWGVTETVKHLEDLPFTAFQSARIVRTEINRAANVGVMAQADNFEYELQKVWISVKDNRTRGARADDHADHYHLDGQTVDLNGLFTDSRNGHQLAHPGDPKGEAEDVINCRCNMTTVPKRNELGRLILKEPRLMAA